MSHNTYTINNVEPSTNGAVALSISALGDVASTTPSAGDVLVYNGAEWAPSQLEYGAVFVGDGSSIAYSTSGATATTAGSVVPFYADAPLVAISGATLSASSGWIDSVSLGAGNYIVQAVIGLTFSASTGVATFRVYQDGVAVGSSGSVGYADISVGASARAFVSVSTSSTIDIRLVTVSSIYAVASQGTRHALRGSLEVRRI